MPALVELPASKAAISALALSLSFVILAYFVRIFVSPTNKAKLPSFFHPVLGSGKSSNSVAEKHDYSNVFPPSQRQELVKLGPKFASVKVVDLSTLPKSSVISMEQDYRTASPSQFIFTGFSVKDVLQLGSFPDYATISGVPLPSPLPNFNIDKAIPRPYRPFRWPYHQTMSLTKMDSDFWIELESTYRKRIAQREKLYAEHGSDVLGALPGSELACRELCEMVLQFVCARYPKQFVVKNGVLENRILQTRWDLGTTPPLEVLLHNIPEDFGIMLRDQETGRYILRAGTVCSSVGWKLSEKVGMGLPAIHKIVPDYKEKMEFSMDRFFTKMPANKPIQRGSWGLEMGEPLYLPSEHPDFGDREKQNPALGPEDINLRVDWQTLRRLPLSGGVVFNFKALFTPLSEFRDEPYVPSLLLKVLREGKDNIMKYKGTWHVEHVAIPALQEYEKFQMESGLMDKNWEPQTLPQAPFFQGWERKWTM